MNGLPFWFNDVLVSLGIIIGFVAAGKAVIFLLDRVVRKLTEKTATQLDDMLLAVVEKPAFNLVALWGVYVGFHRLSVLSSAFDLADKAVFIIAVALVVKVVYDVINVMIDWYGIAAAKRGQEGISKSILPLIKKLVKVFAVISGLIVVLDHFNYNISSLVAALGVSSLAVGLAAKETLSNMISGFTIVADRPFRVGDRIEMEGRHMGDVVEIGLRSTRIRTLENNIVIIPNAKLVDNVVINHSFPGDRQVHLLKVGVEYGTDVEKVKRALRGAAAGVPEILDDPAPAALFAEHGDSALMFHLAYHVADYRSRLVVMDKLNTAVNLRFKEEGIGFAYPTRTLYLKKTMEGDMA